eukprot:scaffold50805_cov31-Tisochrysis_lutea.AAC.10
MRRECECGQNIMKFFFGCMATRGDGPFDRCASAACRCGYGRGGVAVWGGAGCSLGRKEIGDRGPAK